MIKLGKMIQQRLSIQLGSQNYRLSLSPTIIILTMMIPYIANHNQAATGSAIRSLLIVLLTDEWRMILVSGENE